MNLNDLNNLKERLKPSPRMPLLFLGHGSPMNALEENRFTESWRLLGEHLPKPQIILTISAHWESNESAVTAMAHPRTIHDFYNFPKQLYEMEYPAPGDPQFAQSLHELNHHIMLDHSWGLDHGTWAVICHLYPDASIPTLQLSLNRTLTPAEHYEFAKTLSILRRKGVLIIGSGNIVHNLRQLDFNNPNGGYEWAEEARTTIGELILKHNHKRLIYYQDEGEAFKLAIPTNEHYLPLLYILAMQHDGDEMLLFNDTSVAGSLAMTSLLLI